MGASVPEYLLFALFLIFPAAMVFAGSMDLFTMTIPNRISIGMVAGFLVAAPFSSLTLTAFLWHLAAGFSMLVVGILMFSRGWLGGGDAKLLAAATLWLGFDRLFEYLLYVAMAGGALAFGILLYRSLIPPLWLVNQDWAMRLHAKSGGIPYGIAIAAGGLCVYPSTIWFTSLAV